MDLRDAYFGALHKRCAADPSIVVIVGDFDAHWLNRIEQDFPRQYFNAGIAEQNMISVAAGLALEGRKPFVCGQNNFITLRAMEQISVDLCQMRLPVTLVGVGAGFAFSIDGPTHHGVTDLGMMMQLPIDIYNVSDSVVAEYVAGAEAERPVYVRLGKDDFEPFREKAIGLGVALLRGGGMPIVVTSGAMVREVMKIQGLSVLDVYQVSPFPDWLITNALKGGRVIVVEDNLEAPLAKALAGAGIEVDLSICPREYLFEYGSTEFLLKKAGIDAASIEEAIRG